MSLRYFKVDSVFTIEVNSLYWCQKWDVELYVKTCAMSSKNKKLQDKAKWRVRILSCWKTNGTSTLGHDGAFPRI